MFEKIKTRLRRAMSFDILSPSSLSRQPVQDDLVEADTKMEDVSPSKSLHRTPAVSNIRGAAKQDTKQTSPTMSSRTPQHRSPISRKEGALEQDILAQDTNDASMSRSVTGIHAWLSSTPNDGEPAFAIMLESFHTTPARRLSSASTVIINRTGNVDDNQDIESEDAENTYADVDDEDESMEGDVSAASHITQHQHWTDSVQEQELHSPTTTSTVRHKASEEYINYKTDRKRARTVLRDITSEHDEQDVRLQKRLRSDSDTSTSVRAGSPSPARKIYSTRQPVVPRLVHSQPELARPRRESIENDTSHHVGEKVGRRVWSADDVLHALRTGRQEAEDTSKTTPLTSPILSPTTIQKEEYTFQSPPIQAPRPNREPLLNITNNFVPTFLQPPEPELQPLIRPPTPGSTWHLHDSPGVKDPNNGTTSSPTLLGFDGTSDSKIEDADKDDDDARSTFSFTSSLSADLYDADDTGLPAQPNIRHVLRGLNNDARFLQDSLNQIKSLRNKVARYHKRARRTRQSLGELTGEDEEEGRKVMARYLREARDCEVLAERAEEEAREYRRKAGMLVRNAMAEAEMIRGLDEEGEGEGEDEDEL